MRDEEKQQSRRGLLEALHQVEALVMDRQQSYRELRDEDLDEAIDLSFFRLHLLFRGYLGVDPNG